MQDCCLRTDGDVTAPPVAKSRLTAAKSLLTKRNVASIDYAIDSQSKRQIKERNDAFEI